jgi:hemolysin III
MTEPASPGRSGRRLSLGEEIANAVTHGLGVALSAAGFVIMVALALRWGDAWRIASVTIYGITLVLLYTASTLYHSVTNERAKHVLKIVDHSSIYLLIAGTYTPFTLVTLRGPWGYSLFAIVWTIALAGVAAEAFWVYRPKWVSTLVFLGMGWIVVIAIKPLIAGLPPVGLWLLIAGGLSYTIGTAFYVLKRTPYMHAVWHLFVLGGSVCHFLAVVLAVVPGRA